MKDLDLMKAELEAKIDESLEKAKKNRCWEGYKPVPGKKPYSEGSCVKKNDEEEVETEKSDKPFHGYNKKRHSPTGGLNAKFREKYNRETGSNLKAPVTEKNPTGKKAARRRSFCARMSGMKGPTSKDGKLTPKGAALKRWRCSKSEGSDFLKSIENICDEMVNITSLFVEGDEICKAGLPIGTVRQFKDGSYKKVADGKWEKVKKDHSGKTSEIKTSASFLKELSRLGINYKMTTKELVGRGRTTNPFAVRNAERLGLASAGAALDGVSYSFRKKVPAIELDNGEIIALKKFNLKNRLVNKNFNKLLELVKEKSNGGVVKSIESICDKMVNITDRFVKSTEGEGSRGGKVIGHTKSGKPIYEGKDVKYSPKDFFNKPAKFKISEDEKWKLFDKYFYSSNDKDKEKLKKYRSVEDVDVKDIHPTQKNIWGNALGTNENLSHPLVMKVDGKLYVKDGHHRMAKISMKGDDKVKSIVYDLDGLKKEHESKGE